MTRIPSCRIWIIAAGPLLAAAHAVSAQPAPAAGDAPAPVIIRDALAAAGPASGKPQALEEVTVSARRDIDHRTLKRVVIPEFVASHGVLSERSGQIGRWRTAVCPMTVGLKPEHDNYVSQRILAVARDVGAPAQQVGLCTPNVQILFTATPQEEVDDLARTPWIGYAKVSYKQLATFSHPIQAWYVAGTQTDTSLSVLSGVVIDNQFNLIFGPADRFREPRSEIVNIAIIVDATRTRGYSLRTVADYIAVLALTQASLDGCNALPSVIDLFSPDCSARTSPTSITPADVAYLKALYSSDLERRVSMERGEMRNRMLKTIEAH
jgi:hypothetical protein